jgi:hypothetical protein
MAGRYRAQSEFVLEFILGMLSTMGITG